MAKIERFEDLQSCQKARVLTNLIYDLTGQPAFSKDLRLRDQIRDAGGSVMHNIAEGFDSGSNPEFIRFMKWQDAQQVRFNRNSIWLSIESTSPTKI